MHLNEYTSEELLALIGLLRHVMEADGTISDSEESTLESFALELGRAPWVAALERAEHATATREQALAVAGAVSRESVQDDILARLCRMSGLDGAATEELDIVAELIASWNASS